MNEVPTEAREGARLLGEIEDADLDEVLCALRRNTQIPAPSRRPKPYPVPELDALVAQNFRMTQTASLHLTGRHLPLIYKLVSSLVGAPSRKAVVVIDAEHRFDATRLCGVNADSRRQHEAGAHAVDEQDEDDLRHVHVFRPARCSPDRARELIASAETWMLYGHHESRAREWWGTIVIGTPFTTTAASTHAHPGRPVAHADVTASWRGWMRIDREELPGFHLGISAQEALRDREKRQDAVDAALWRASCQWGSFSFTETPEEVRRSSDEVAEESATPADAQPP